MCGGRRRRHKNKRRKTTTTTKFGKAVKIEMSTQWRFHPLKKEQPNDFYLNHDSVHKFTRIWNMVPLDECDLFACVIFTTKSQDTQCLHCERGKHNISRRHGCPYNTECPGACQCAWIFLTVTVIIFLIVTLIKGIILNVNVIQSPSPRPHSQLAQL